MPTVRLLALNGLLLVLVVLALGAFELLGRPEAAVESSVRRYADAISSSNLDGAMAEIAPDQRQAWQSWVSGQLGNVYEVRGIAVRAPSPLDRLLQHATPRPVAVTVVMDVDRGYPEFYQATTQVPVEQSGGQWFLGAPLLATDQ